MNRRTIFAAAIRLMILAAVPASIEAGSLTGTVRNAAGLDPIAGADVTVHVLIPDSIPYPAVTGVDGSYDITGIVPGNEIYVVIAWKSGFRQSYTRIADLGAQDLAFDIVLEPDSASGPPGGGGDSGNVAGTIYEVAAGGGLEGLPGATVTLYAGLGTSATVSGAGGAYFARIPSGSYAIAVSGPGIDSLALTGLSVDSLGATVNAVVKRTVTGVDDGNPVFPLLYALEQNYPNPFNPVTTIRFSLPAAGYVRLAVYTLLGEEVAVLAEGVRQAGEGTVSFDAGGLPSGIYCVRISAGGSFTETRKMVLMR